MVISSCGHTDIDVQPTRSLAKNPNWWWCRVLVHARRLYLPGGSEARTAAVGYATPFGDAADAAMTLEELGEEPVPPEEGMEAGGHARLQAAWDTHSALMDLTGKVSHREHGERERE
jgi:hypothetical protein